MPKVTFVQGKDKIEVEVPVGANLRTEAAKAGVQIYQGPDKLLNCRGLGLCGTCKVYVKEGKDKVAAKGLRERIKLAMMFSSIGHEEEIRLACQTTVQGDCTVETCPSFNFSGETEKGKHFWERPYPNK